MSHKPYFTVYTKGFTLIEVLIVLILSILISSIVYTSFSSLQDRQILDAEVDQVVSYIQKARIDSLNSKGGDSHGIIFGTSTITVIEVSGATTTHVYTLNNRVVLATSTLGTTTLTFARISGLPSVTGTTTYTYSVGGKVKGTSTVVINGLGVTD